MYTPGTLIAMTISLGLIRALFPSSLTAYKCDLSSKVVKFCICASGLWETKTTIMSLSSQSVFQKLPGHHWLKEEEKRHHLMGNPPVCKGEWGIDDNPVKTSCPDGVAMILFCLKAARGSTNFSMKGQMLNILGFMSHILSVAYFCLFPATY